MHRWKRAGTTTLGLAAVAITGVGAWFLLVELWSTLSTLDKSVFAALITGTLVASAAIYVKHVEHRHSVEAQFTSRLCYKKEDVAYNSQ